MGKILLMKEDGIDISGHTSNNVDEYLAKQFDIILTVCDHARENCPYIPDPAKATGTEEKILREFRKTRDLIKTYCKEMLDQA